MWPPHLQRPPAGVAKNRIVRFEDRAPRALPLKMAELSARGDVPEADGIVSSATDQRAIVVDEVQVQNVVAVTVQHTATF